MHTPPGDRLLASTARQYRFATRALRATGNLGILKFGVGVLCASMVVLGVIVEFHPMGPAGNLALALHLGSVLSAGVVAVGWWILPWPTLFWAICFVVWADVAIAVAAWTLAAPQAQLLATIHMSMIGIFIAFLLGWRALCVHCTFVLALIIGLCASAMAEAHMTLMDLYIYVAPAIATVVVLPAVIQTVIESARKTLQRTAADANTDPLTGLHNRRSVMSLARRGVRAHDGGVVIVALIDIDRFKEHNDRFGHPAGDAAIVGVGSLLRDAVTRPDLVGRIGGDEFVAVAFRETGSEADDFADKLRHYISRVGAAVTVSIGVAWTSRELRRPNLISMLLAEADVTMYRAKSLGGNQAQVSGRRV